MSVTYRPTNSPSRLTLQRDTEITERIRDDTPVVVVVAQMQHDVSCTSVQETSGHTPDLLL